MSIKLPKEANDLLDEIEKVNWRQSTRLRLKAAGFHLQDEEVERLRESMRGALIVFANDIFEWCERLVRLPTTVRIWEVLGPETRILIYWSKHYAGKSPSPTDMAGRAQIKVGRVIDSINGQASPILWHEEQYKWRPAQTHEIRTAEELVDTVHPQFLKNMHELLKGPQAWKWVLQDLKNRNPLRDN